MGGRREGDQQSHECRNTGVRQHRQRSTHTHLAMRVRGLHSTHMPHHTHGSLHTQAARVPQRHAAQRHVNTPCAGSAHHAHAPPPAWRPRVSPTPASHGPGRLARPRTASHVAGGGVPPPHRLHQPVAQPRTATRGAEGPCTCLTHWHRHAHTCTAPCTCVLHTWYTQGCNTGSVGVHPYAEALCTHVAHTLHRETHTERAGAAATCAHRLHTYRTHGARMAHAHAPHYICMHPAPVTHMRILSPHHIYLHPITYVCTSPPLHMCEPHPTARHFQPFAHSSPYSL